MNKKYEYSGGKTGIGPFALNNKNHILTQLANLRFAENPLLQALGFTGLDGINSKDETVYKRDSKGNIIYENDSTIMVEDKGLRILDWISAMINAHVDVAKDPYVIRLNVRQYTYNICNFLLRVGYGKSTFYFLPQRILKDMAVAYEAASGIYGVNNSKSKTATVNQQITDIRKKYFKLYEDACKEANINLELSQDNDGSVSFNDLSVSFNQIASKIIDRDNLITLLQDDKKLDKLSASEKANYYKQQLLISELFLQLNDLAQDMSKLVQLSQIDTKRYGNNFVEQNRFLYRLNSLIVNTSLFNSEDIINYYRDTFLETKLINGIIEPASIFQSLMFRSNDGFKNSISRILLMTNRIDTNDEALNKTISNELEGQLRYRFLLHKEINVFDMLYGENSMAHRLAKIKSDILNGKYDGMLTQDGKIANKLLNHLGTLTRMSTDKYIAPNIITRNRINDGDKYLKQTLSTYWEELLDSPYEEIRQFANDLFYYQLATTAGNFSKNGIFNIIPIRLIKESGYNQFMRNSVKMFSANTDIDYDNFFLNNWQNNKIVKPIQLYKEAYDPDANEIVQQLTVPVLFSNQQLPQIKKRYPILMQLNNPSIAKNEYGVEVFQPYVKIVLDKTTPAGTLLYKLIGTVKNKQGISKPIYALVNKKGLNESGRVVKEYDNYSNSMFDFNNIENALNAKESITLDAINQLLSAGDKNAVKQWQTAISKIDYIHDYIPETKALSLNAFSLESRPSRSVRDYTRTDNIKEMKNSNDVSEQTNTSVSTFIFNDGFSVNIPFTLNEQQIELLHTLESFYNNPKAYGNILTVSGYAGTGKTTIIGIFNKWLEHKYEQAIFSSPTHRANAVTKMNNPNAVVATLHSIFGLSPIVDLESGNYDLRKLKTEQVYKPKIKPNQLLIIDESSMVSNDLYNFIQDYVKASGIKVIFLGDQAQLSPVKDNSISPVFTENDSKIELTKVERTGDNPILTEATSLRNGNDLSYQTNIINGEGVEYVPTNSQRVDDILNTIVNSDEFKNNPLHFKVLAATNAVVQQTNLKVREQRYGKNAPQLMVGDILMGYSNITDEDVELVRNSVDYIVDSVSEKKTNTIKVLDGKSITVEGYDIVLRNAFNGEVQDKIFVLDNNVSQNKLNEISDLIEYFNRAINDAFKSHNYRIIGALQQALSEIQRNTILMKDVQSGSALKIRKTLDYGYACTVHKSQGGTYNKIMYYADTVAPFEKKVQNQLDYVAVSRAKENVYIVTNHEIKEQMSKDITTETNDQQTIVQTHNETLQVLGGVSDEIANSEMKDAIKIAKEGITFESALSTVNPIFNNTEIQQIKLNGASLKVMSVSRYTDPAFFANEIVKFLEENAKKSFTDPTRVNVIELWTKHDGEPIQKILQACKKYKVAPMVSFSITTLGNTPLEQGVLEYKTLLDLIRKLVESKDLDPRTTTIRIDPILPGYTNMDDIKDVIRIGKSIGIRKYVTSLVQSYGYLDGTMNDRKVTSGINNALAKVGQTYDWDTYYGRITYGKNKGKINFIPKQQYIDQISEVLLDINKDPEIRLETCSFTIKGLKASACLDPLIIERVTGVDVTRTDGTYDRDTSRPDCMCYGCHGDKFRWNEKQCFSSCAYCYAAHSGDSNFNYYNADGTLKDRPLTRVNNNFIGNDGTDNANQTRQMVNIYSGTGDNVDLSNFAERPFVYQNTRFKTVEGAFQAQKLNYSNYIDSSMSQRYIEMLNKFANATGYEARTLGRSISSLDRQTWDRDSESILKESMKASFEQNTNAKQRLLNTGDAILTHKNKYGKEQDNGRFSRLLTEIREEFRNEPQSQKYTGNLLEQADFSEFNEMREEGKKIADVCKGK